MTQDDKDMIVKFKQLLDGGKKASGMQVTEVYNRVFGTRLASTSCASCVRQRIGKLWDKYQEENDTNN